MRAYLLLLAALGAKGDSAVEPFDQRENSGACTVLSVAPGAMEDDAVVSTQTADCLDCDFRQASVPRAMNSEREEPRKIFRYRSQYPTQVSDRAETWKPENLDTSLEQSHVWLSEEWDEYMTIGHLPPGAVDDALVDIYNRFQGEGEWVDPLAEPMDFLFSYLENIMGVINEKQVGMGETTCSAMLGAAPRPCPNCEGPLLDITALSRIAMERCGSARCAIELMGLLAERYGYYGADVAVFENGEALSVTDKNEAWIFHIIPDDTARSAVWAAQRVPEGHVAVVANMFIIGEIPDEAMSGLATAPRDHIFFDHTQSNITDVFRASSNMREVADRAGLTAEGRNGMFHFLKTFGQREPASIGHADLTHYATLRVWRVFTIVDPSLAEEGRYLHQPRSDYLGESQPFSVPVADQLTMADIFNINRDLFDGTAFDLRFGLAAGPWGDPNRFDVCHDCPDPTLTEEDVAHGAFPRPISMFRTSYSQITVSRAAEPDFLAMAWVGQYAPHAGAYVPIYVITGEVPKPMATGHLFRYDPEVLYWCFAVVGNWARLMYIFIEKEIRDTRKGIEYGVRARQGGMEEAVKQIMHQADEGAYYVGKYAGPEHAAKVVQRAVRESVMVFSEYTDSCVDEYMTAWVKLYAYLIAKYHDGMVMHTTGGTDGKGGGVDGKGTIWMQKMFYPKKWLTAVGWFNSFWPDDPPGTPAGIPFPAPTIPPPSDNPTPAPVAESEAPTVSEETVAENTDTPVTQFPDEDFPTPREDTDDDSTQDYVQVVYSASDYTDTAEPSEGGGAPQEATTFVSGGGDSTSFPLVAISALWAMIGALVGFAFGRRSKIATSRAGQDPAWTRAMDQSKRYGAVEARA